MPATEYCPRTPANAVRGFVLPTLYVILERRYHRGHARGGAPRVEQAQ